MTASTAVGTQRAFYFLATLIMVAFLLFAGREVFVPLALAVLLAFILSVPQCWLEARGAPRYVSVPIVALAAFGFIGALGWLAVDQVRGLAAELPKYEETIRGKLIPIREMLRAAQEMESGPRKLETGPAGTDSSATPDAKPRAADEKKEEQKSAADNAARERVVVQSGESAVLNWLRSLIGPLLGVIVTGVLVLVLTVFMLARRENLRDRFIRLIGRRHMARTTKAMDEAARRVSHYLLLQTLTNISFGIAVGIGLAFIGVPYPALWGLLTAVFRFIPYVGIWVVAALPMTLSLAVFTDWYEPALVIGLYLGLELLIANVIEPLVFGHGIGVMPIALLLAVVFWAWLWGPVGLVLSIPLTVCLVVIGKHVPSLRFLEVLLEEAPPLDPASSLYQRLLAGDTDAVLEEMAKSKAEPEKVYNEVFMPALVRLRRDRLHRQLNAEEEHDVLQRFRALLGRFASDPPPPEKGHDAVSSNGHGAPDGEHPAVVVCPFHGELDEVAVEALQHAMRGSSTTVDIVPWPRLTRSGRHEDGAGLTLCVVAVPPGRVAHVAQLCHRLRDRFPNARILVAYWRGNENLDRIARRFREAGADEVAGSLLDTCKQISTPPEPLLLPAPSHTA